MLFKCLQGYEKQSLNEVLTPAESMNYVLYNTLPSRIVYDPNQQAYFVKGNNGGSRNGLRKRKGQHVEPRWKYLMSKMVPSLEIPFSASDLMGGLQSLASMKSAMGGGEQKPASEKDDEQDKDEDAENNEDDEDKDEDKDEENEEENEDKDEDNDEPAENETNYKEIAMEVLNSDLTKLAIETGIGFLPGGAAALAAMRTGSKVAGLAKKVPSL